MAFAASERDDSPARRVRPEFVDPENTVGSAPVRSAFVPVLLLAIAMSASLAYQTVQLARERQQLDLMNAGLQPQEQASIKLRASLDQVATATAKLAAEGNGNARAIVNQLRSRGITIDPSKVKTPP